MKKTKLLIFIFLLSLISASQIYSQSTGKIMGVIKDLGLDEGIPFANVLVNGTTIGTASDIDGNFVILNIPPGVYSVTASYVGYQKLTISDVRINVGFTTNLEFELSSGDIELDAIIVQGERNPLIRQDLTNPTVAITSETIDALPVDNITDVIKLQAGVVQGDDGTLHVRGGRSDEISFQLNGLSVNDPFGNSKSVGVATNAVQEVSVSTGTFSAEFGNALSGVVNYVTKEGGNKYSFSLRGYAGDYVSSRDELFNNIDDIDVLNRSRLEGTFGGPIPFSNNTKFFVSGIYSDFKGSYYGQRIYNTTDSYLTPDNFASSDSRTGSATDPYFFNPYHSPADSNGLPTGDGAIVALNPSHSYNIQGNISHNFSSLIKLKYELVSDYSEYKDGDGLRTYRYNPDGNATYYDKGIVHALDLTHTINDRIFYTIKGSYSEKAVDYYLYEDENDPRYLPGFYSQTWGNTLYYTGGTVNYRSERKTITRGIKADVVAQLFGIHEVKAGVEYRKHDVRRDGYTITFEKEYDFNGQKYYFPLNYTDAIYGTDLPIVRGKTLDPSSYHLKPTNFAAYMQDKIELAKTLILNAGVRYEYFDPGAEYNPSISQELTDEGSGYLIAGNKKVDPKHMISPRLSVSYPITERGVIRFSYGHFYQIGQLSSLYTNNQYFVTNLGSTPRFGNPNVEPQRSVQYEMGLQQQLTDDFKFDLTAFNKDVRDYIYTQNVYTPEGRQYRTLTNLAYSNVKGVTLSFIKRRSPGSMFAASLDYTFQIAEGNRTEPTEDLFFSEASGKQTETYLVPLSFDRSHLINGTIQISDPKNWTAGFVYNIQTGTPYYPELPPTLSTITYEQNSANKSMQWNVDFKFEKFFEVGGLDLSVFLQIDNLFDTENEKSVYASSGEALSSVEQTLNAVQFDDLRTRIERKDGGMLGTDVLDNYYKRAERVSSPREIRLGFSIVFK
ncbi:MAG: TonB-dependent receptor [Melioribacteraceae bacterium]|nr:TonB-dependent receptor [Melioribacteraceae bacterium]